jgi:hypothetical protein
VAGTFLPGLRRLCLRIPVGSGRVLFQSTKSKSLEDLNIWLEVTGDSNEDRSASCLPRWTRLLAYTRRQLPCAFEKRVYSTKVMITLCTGSAILPPEPSYSAPIAMCSWRSFPARTTFILGLDHILGSSLQLCTTTPTSSKVTMAQTLLNF